MEDKKIRWISFQSLIGGMMIGAEQAFGTPPLFTIDYEGVDKGNSALYIHYMNNVRKLGIRQLVLNGDLLSMATTFKTEEDQKFFDENINDIDVVSAVPICSGLSMCNKTQKGSDSKQNDNMIGCTKLTLEIIKPKAYIFENAPNLFTNAGKAIRGRFEQLAAENGYSVSWIKTNTNKHSNVQYRSRTFGIMWNSEFTPQLKRVDDKVGSIVDYLSTIDPSAKYNTEEFMHFDSTDFANNGYLKYLKAKYGPDFREHWASIGSCASSVIEANKDLENCDMYMDDSEKKQVAHMIHKRSLGLNFYDQSPLYYGPNKVCTIYGRSVIRLVHPTEPRGYSLRELMKFMGLPDDYEFAAKFETKTDLYKHMVFLSQNVPVITSRDWHKQIRDFLEGNVEFTKNKVDMFNNESAVVVTKKKLDLEDFGFDI